MKKTILTLAAVALATSAAMATPPSPTPVPTGSVVGSATSSVVGGVSSGSTVTGVNQYSVHGSLATANNTTAVVGGGLAGQNGASVGTGAVTVGQTFTSAGGVGNGGAYAGAGQAGHGNVTATAALNGTTVDYSLMANSQAGVSTFSTATVVNSGLAMSGSLGGAGNATHATVGSGNIPFGVTTNAAGVSAGLDGVKTWGTTVGGNESVTAGGQSGQAGNVSGSITRDIAPAPVVNVPPTNTNPGSNGNNHCNNGAGNGSNCTPGHSSGYNNGQGKKDGDRH